MKKVLYITQYDTDGTAYYRLAPLMYLNSPDIKVTKTVLNGYTPVTWADFINQDILILERPSSPVDLQLIKLAKDSGLKIILDYDDDILHVDQYNPLYAQYEECKKLIIDCMMLADMIWLSTFSLKKSFQWHNNKILVIPNAHNDYIHPTNKKRAFNTETKKAFWRGGISHAADVYNVADMLIKTINEKPDWHFSFLGDRFIYMEQRCGNNYQPISQMSLLQYFAFLQQENPNILFHPLADTLFNKSKSNIAWMEGTYAGAAFFGNVKLPEMNSDICLDIANMSELMEDTEALQMYNCNSWDCIMSNYLLSNVNNLRKESILNL